LLHKHHKTAPSPIRTGATSSASSSAGTANLLQQPSSPTSAAVVAAAAAAAAASASKLPSNGTTPANTKNGQSLDTIMLATAAKQKKATLPRCVQMKYSNIAHTYVLTMHLARVLSRFKAALACVLIVSATLLDYAPRDRSVAAFLNNFDAMIDAGAVGNSTTSWNTLVQQYANFYSSSTAWCKPLSLELGLLQWQWDAHHYIRTASLITHRSKHGIAEFDCTRARVYSALLSMALVTVVVLLLFVCAFRCEIVLYETVMAPLDRVMTKLKACIASIDRASSSPIISTRITTGRKSSAVQKRAPSVRLSRDQLKCIPRSELSEALDRMTAFDEYTSNNSDDTGTNILETDVMESAVDKCKYLLFTIPVNVHMHKARYMITVAHMRSDYLLTVQCAYIFAK
jgi:hypothetical protein